MPKEGEGSEGEGTTKKVWFPTSGCFNKRFGHLVAYSFASDLFGPIDFGCLPFVVASDSDQGQILK